MDAKNVEVTLGNYYEQFGSGFILRTYEERSLGIDNSLLGARVVARPFKGVQLKAFDVCRNVQAVFKAHDIKAVADARRAKSNAHSTLPPLR